MIAAPRTGKRLSSSYVESFWVLRKDTFRALQYEVDEQPPRERCEVSELLKRADRRLEGDWAEAILLEERCMRARSLRVKAELRIRLAYCETLTEEARDLLLQDRIRLLDEACVEADKCGARHCPERLTWGEQLWLARQRIDARHEYVRLWAPKLDRRQRTRVIEEREPIRRPCDDQAASPTYTVLTALLQTAEEISDEALTVAWDASPLARAKFLRSRAQTPMYMARYELGPVLASRERLVALLRQAAVALWADQASTVANSDDDRWWVDFPIGANYRTSWERREARRLVWARATAASQLGDFRLAGALLDKLNLRNDDSDDDDPEDDDGILAGLRDEEVDDRLAAKADVVERDSTRSAEDVYSDQSDEESLFEIGHWQSLSVEVDRIIKVDRMINQPRALLRAFAVYHRLRSMHDSSRIPRKYKGRYEHYLYKLGELFHHTGQKQMSEAVVQLRASVGVNSTSPAESVTSDPLEQCRVLAAALDIEHPLAVLGEVEVLWKSILSDREEWLADEERLGELENLCDRTERFAPSVPRWRASDLRRQPSRPGTRTLELGGGGSDITTRATIVLSNVDADVNDAWFELLQQRLLVASARIAWRFSPVRLPKLLLLIAELQAQAGARLPAASSHSWAEAARANFYASGVEASSRGDWAVALDAWERVLDDPPGGGPLRTDGRAYAAKQIVKTAEEQLQYTLDPRDRAAAVGGLTEVVSKAVWSIWDGTPGEIASSLSGSIAGAR